MYANFVSVSTTLLLILATHLLFHESDLNIFSNSQIFLSLANCSKFI